MKNRLLRVEEVALLIGVTAKTVNSWYYYKRDFPGGELTEYLPDFQRGENNIRYWNSKDIPKLVEFKKRLPRGRNGILGDINQKYWRATHQKKKKVQK